MNSILDSLMLLQIFKLYKIFQKFTSYLHIYFVPNSDAEFSTHIYFPLYSFLSTSLLFCPPHSILPSTVDRRHNAKCLAPGVLVTPEKCMCVSLPNIWLAKLRAVIVTLAAVSCCGICNFPIDLTVQIFSWVLRNISVAATRL